MGVDEAWDVLRNMDVSQQTLEIVTSINGYSLETLESVLYAVTGYNSFEQWEDEE